MREGCFFLFASAKAYEQWAGQDADAFTERNRNIHLTDVADEMCRLTPPGFTQNT